MVASVLIGIGRAPGKLYRLLGRASIAVRLWDISQRMAAIERRRRALDAKSRSVILHRLELERRDALLSGRLLVPARGTAPVLVRSMGRAVAR